VAVILNIRWLTVINLSVVSGFVFLGVNVVSPILPQYARTFNVSVALTGWAISSYALARVLTDLPAGMLNDRYSCKKAMIAGLAMISLSSIVASLAPTYLVLILARASSGTGSALYIISATSLLARVSHGADRGKMMGMYSSMVFMGMSAGPAIGGFVAAYYGIQAPFLLYAFLTIVGIAFTIPLHEPPIDNDTKSESFRWTDLKTILSSKSFMLVTFAVFSLFFLRSSVRSTLVPLYASINLGLREDQIGLLMTVAIITTAISSFPSGWLSDKIGRKRPIMTCVFSSAFLIVLVPFQATMDSLMIFMAAYGFVTGLQGSISAWPADVSPPEKMGTAMGIYRLMADFGFFLGPITVTYFNDYLNPARITAESFVIPSIIAMIAGLSLIKAGDPSRESN
jgi:MFS family permease